MNKVLCSTGAVIGRPLGEDYYKLLPECRDRLDCDGFEFMIYRDWYDQYERIAEYLVANKIYTPVLHMEKQIGERISRNQPGDTEYALEHFERNCSFAEWVGAKMLVLHLWGGLDSDYYIDHNIEMYPELRKIAESHGLLLTVENVVCAVSHPLEHMRKLKELFPDIKFTFDTKMAQFHREMDQLYDLPEEWIRDSIVHMHINDYSGGYMDWKHLQTLHIGDGDVDFERFFSFIKGKYKGDFTVESTSVKPDGTVDYDKLNQSFRTIRELFGPAAQADKSVHECVLVT